MMNNISGEKLVSYNNLIANLYRNHDRNKSIHNFLTGLKNFCFFEKGDVYFYKKDEQGKIKFDNFIFSGWSDDLRTYMALYDIDDVLPLIASPQSIVFRTSDVFITSERKKSRYYKEVLEPCNMHYSIEGNLYYEPNGFICGFGLHRSEKHGDFTQEEIDYVKLAKVHLTNIVKDMCEPNSFSDKLREHRKVALPYNVAIWIFNDDYEVIDANMNHNERISANKNSIENMLISICSNLLQQHEENADSDSIKLNNTCRISFEGQSYYVDVTYESDPNTPRSGRYTCQVYDYTTILENLLINVKRDKNLTEREFDILKCMFNGMSNIEIANELFISLPTVKKHMTNIYHKLDIEGRYQLFNSIF